MMKGIVEPSVVPTMVQATKQTIELPQMRIPQETQLKEQKLEVPQMTFPQEKQLREQSQEIKKEHDTTFPKGEEHLHFDVTLYKDLMETLASPQHLQ